MSTSATATLVPTAAAPSRATVTALSEGVSATRNALTLGATMVAGMGISMVVRLLLVRMLGPEAFGDLRFAENAAEMLFVGLTLGVDTLLRKEAAVDAAGAHAYLRAITFLRVVGGAVLLTGIAAALAVTGHRGDALTLFAVLAMAQFTLVLNNSYAALEHASGRVGWIASLTLRFKLAWAALAVGVLWLAPSAIGFALVFLAVEGGKLFRLGSRHTGRFKGVPRPSLRTAATAAAASLPFFVNYLAYSLYARLGVWWLGGTASSQEVGWYGAASTIAAVAMMGMPLISWVLVPASARAGQDAPEGATPLIDGALRLSLLVAVPVSAVLGLAAPFWVHFLFGSAYQEATGALQALAPTFTLAYVATVCSIGLIQQERVRALATVSLAGLALSLILNAVLIPWGTSTLGTGGAATGAAYATLGTELAVTAVLLRLSRTGSTSTALARTAAALVAATLTAAVVSTLLAGSWAAAPAAVAVFPAVVWASGAITPADIHFLRSVVRRTRSHVSASV